MNEKKFCSFYKLNDDEINKLNEKVSEEDNIRDSEPIHPVLEQIIPPAPKKTVKTKFILNGKVVAVAVSLAVVIFGVTIGINAMPHLDMERHYGISSGYGYDYYDKDKKWLAQFSLRDIYIDENEMLVGVFDEPFDLSHVKKYTYGYSFDKSTNYKISNFPSEIKGIPQEAMPDYLEISYSLKSRYFLSEFVPYVSLHLCYNDRHAYYFYFIKEKYMDNIEIKEVKKNIKEYRLTE